MPTYEYQCSDKICNHTWESEAKITDSAETICPQCQKETAKRLISGGQGFQLKGKGWFRDGY